MMSRFKIFIAILSFGIAVILSSCGLSPSNISNVKTTASIEEAKAPRKCKIFNEVKQVQSLLSEAGIGELRQWRNDSFGWMSSTQYYSFGSSSSINGMQNNLAYYLESESENYIEKVKIMLNINNSSEKYQAISKFDKTSKKTFELLKLKMPNGLSEAIKSEKKFSSENSEYKVSLVLNRSKIDTWKLTIEAK